SEDSAVYYCARDGY
nr:immunoglobulin heavy chain junction region [Mus musculus]